MIKVGFKYQAKYPTKMKTGDLKVQFSAPNTKGGYSHYTAFIDGNIEVSEGTWLEILEITGVETIWLGKNQICSLQCKVKREHDVSESKGIDINKLDELVDDLNE